MAVGESYSCRTLIARAPMRLSFAGGGTDLPAYYERYGGMVVSVTIDKYVYVHCGANGEGNGHDAQITSADYHTFYRHNSGMPMGWDGELALPRAILHSFGVERDISLFLAAEVPPGTGLGSSSAAAVALVGGVAAYLGQSLSRQRVAELACQVELGKLKAPIGKQDQFAAAFGGCNAIMFTSSGVTVQPVAVSSDVLSWLERRLLLFFTGISRDSSTILQEQQRACAEGSVQTLQGLHRIKEAAVECKRCLEAGDLDGVGRVLDEGWREKRRLVAGITNHRIDQVYDVAMSCGAAGGKIAGAGGGGFLLLYCHENRQAEVTRAMEERGLRRMGFHFDRQGLSVTSLRWMGTEEWGVARRNGKDGAAAARESGRVEGRTRRRTCGQGAWRPTDVAACRTRELE